MSFSENQSGLARYLNINLAVVEVRNGESQEDAWRRYLTDHPEKVGVRIKIFHYPNSTPENHKGLIPKDSGRKRNSPRGNSPTLAILPREEDTTQAFGRRL